jgi:hypothetical protein
MRLRLPRVVRALVNDVRRALCLEIGVVAETDLPDGTVFPEDFVEVGTGEVEVAVCVSGERGEDVGLRVDEETLGGGNDRRKEARAIWGWMRTGDRGMDEDGGYRDG